MPSFKKGQQYKKPDETLNWLKDELMPDRDTQKFLFLNQFGLKTIFDKVCGEQTPEENKDEDNAKAVKKKSSFRRQSTIKQGNSPTKLSRIDSIVEEPELSQKSGQKSRISHNSDENDKTMEPMTPRSKISARSN